MSLRQSINLRLISFLRSILSKWCRSSSPNRHEWLTSIPALCQVNVQIDVLYVILHIHSTLSYWMHLSSKHLSCLQPTACYCCLRTVVALSVDCWNTNAYSLICNKSVLWTTSHQVIMTEASNSSWLCALSRHWSSRE
jgi:hypothetical protein